MAAEAVLGPRLELEGRVAVLAGHVQVRVAQLEGRLLVVLEDVLAGLAMAALALGAQALLVRVVGEVALGVAAAGRGRLVLPVGMAALAGGLLVEAVQR